MVNDEQGYYVLAQHGGLYSRGFSISVIISILLLFNCMTSRNFGSNVSVMIDKSTAEFMILTHTPDARDLRCGLLSRRATGSYEETLEFAMLRHVLNSSESFLRPLHCERDGIYINIVSYVTGVLHHLTFCYYNRSSVAPRLISLLRRLKFLKNRISYYWNSESTFNVEILIIAVSGGRSSPTWSCCECYKYNLYWSQNDTPDPVRM